jgi:hypothetical protein
VAGAAALLKAADPDVDRASPGEYLCELSGVVAAGTSLQTALAEPICEAVGVGAQIRTSQKSAISVILLADSRT